MASLPYPLNRLYTHIVSVIATTQSACILMSVWVWQGCHTLLQIPILLFLKNLFSCSSVFPQQHVLMFFCLFKQKHVLMFFCLFNNNMFSCSSVFSKTTCPHVLLSFKNNMFFCLSPKRTMFSRPTMSLCRQKKTAESNAPSR